MIGPARRWQFVFVLEQALGHIVHAMNIERVLDDQPDIDATIIPIAPDTMSGMRALPVLRNWSLQSSLAALVRAHPTEHPLDQPGPVLELEQLAEALAELVLRQRLGLQPAHELARPRLVPEEPIDGVGCQPLRHAEVAEGVEEAVGAGTAQETSTMLIAIIETKSLFME